MKLVLSSIVPLLSITLSFQVFSQWVLRVGTVVHKWSLVLLFVDAPLSSLILANATSMRPCITVVCFSRPPLTDRLCRSIRLAPCLMSLVTSRNSSAPMHKQTELCNANGVRMS